MQETAVHWFLPVVMRRYVQFTGKYLETMKIYIQNFVYSLMNAIWFTLRHAAVSIYNHLTLAYCKLYLLHITIKSCMHSTV